VSILANSWVHGGLRICADVMLQVERVGIAAYLRGEEGCGYLSGPLSAPLHVTKAVELENLANRYHSIDPVNHPRTGRDYFKINSLKFERTLAESQNLGCPIKVFFHSHMNCGAYFSQEDAAAMTLDGTASPTYPLCYLVTAIDAGQVSKHALFRWDEATRAFVESPFTVVEPLG